MRLRVLVVLLALGGGCRPSSRSVPTHRAASSVLPSSSAHAASLKGVQFVDVTQAAGIDFIHSIGDSELDNLVESVGGGAAFLDYDRDGWLDLYVVTGVHHQDLSHGAPPPFRPKNRLYRNRGDGTFEDVTDSAGVGLERYSIAVAVGDYDNDGYPDIYVCCYYGPNALFHNNRNGTFTEVAKQAGVDDAHCSVAAAFFDYDNDGNLDLYVGNYITFDPAYKYYYQPDAFPGPLSYGGQPDVLYRNRGDGTFEDVTTKMNVFNPTGRAMGVAAADYDGDGFTDLYVANDAMPKELYRNESGRRFVEVAHETGVAFNNAGEGTASMMATWGDYDGDGLLDLFVPDNTFKSLYHNEGKRFFTDQSAAAGVAAAGSQYVSWGSGLIDYDNDGDLDLFIINGALHHLWGQEDVLLQNDGKGNFRDVSAQSGDYFQRKLCGRGACFGDYDNDGDVDAFIVNLNDRPVLLRNEGGNRNNWLTIELRGRKGKEGEGNGRGDDSPSSNRDGVGAKVTLLYDKKTVIAQREGGGAYLSANDPRLHFGLGKSQRVERIAIRWPSGRTQILKDVRAHQILPVEERGD